LLGYYANELGYNPEMGYETSHANLIIDRMVYSPEVIDEYNKSDFTFVLIEYYGKALYRCPAYR